MSPPTTPNPVLVPQSIDLVWEMGLRKIGDQIELFDALDSKTGVIVGFVVVSIVEILGFLILAATEVKDLNHSPALSRIVVVFFFGGLVSSLVSTLVGLRALRVREFAIGFDYKKFVEAANLPPAEIKTRFLDDLLQSVEKNKVVLREKVTSAKIAAAFVLLGIVCYAIVVAMVFVRFVPMG